MKTNYTTEKGLASRSLFTLGALSIFVFSPPQGFGQSGVEHIKLTEAKIKTIPGHGMSKGEYPFDENGYYQKEWVSTSAKSPEKSSITVRPAIPITSSEHSNYGLIDVMKAEPEPKPKSEPKSIGNFSPLTQTSPKPPQPQLPPQPQEPPIPAGQILTDTEAKKHGFIGPYSKMVASETILTTVPIKPNTTERKPLAQVPEPQKKAEPEQKPDLDQNSAKSSVETLYHKVTSGDTLSSLSRQYGVSIEALKKTNGLTNDIIRVGQSLRLALTQHTLGLPQ